MSVWPWAWHTAGGRTDAESATVACNNKNYKYTFLK